MKENQKNGVKHMGVPTAIIIMIALMMLMFGIAAVYILMKKGGSLKQTIDKKPEQNFHRNKDEQK